MFFNFWCFRTSTVTLKMEPVSRVDFRILQYELKYFSQVQNKESSSFRRMSRHLFDPIAFSSGIKNQIGLSRLTLAFLTSHAASGISASFIDRTQVFPQASSIVRVVECIKVLSASFIITPFQLPRWSQTRRQIVLKVTFYFFTFLQVILRARFKHVWPNPGQGFRCCQQREEWYSESRSKGRWCGKTSLVFLITYETIIIMSVMINEIKLARFPMLLYQLVSILLIHIVYVVIADQRWRGQGQARHWSWIHRRQDQEYLDWKVISVTDSMLTNDVTILIIGP